MKTIEDIVNELNLYPKDTRCEAYEGECNGISLYDSNNRPIGFIYLIETDRSE